jgi:hypothetical protein
MRTKKFFCHHLCDDGSVHDDELFMHRVCGRDSGERRQPAGG